MSLKATFVTFLSLLCFSCGTPDTQTTEFKGEGKDKDSSHKGARERDLKKMESILHPKDAKEDITSSVSENLRKEAQKEAEKTMDPMERKLDFRSDPARLRMNPYVLNGDIVGAPMTDTYSRWLGIKKQK